MRFEKTHAYGNDFMSFKRADCADLTPEKIQSLSDRKTGVGFDQLIVFEQEEPAQKYCTITFYNADGTFSGACGNGARCAARLFADATGLTAFDIRVTQKSGQPIVIPAETLPNRDVRLLMGKPKRSAGQIPLALGIDPDRVTFPELHPYEGACVNVGNPHLVFVTPETVEISNEELTRYGGFAENYEFFPERVNVEFIRKIGVNHIQMRVWERGAGITSACGTGACASAVIAVMKGLCIAEAPVKISVDGGEMFVSFTPNGEIILQGEAVRVFTGEMAA